MDLDVAGRLGRGVAPWLKAEDIDRLHQDLAGHGVTIVTALRRPVRPDVDLAGGAHDRDVPAGPATLAFTGTFLPRRGPAPGAQ